MLVVSVTAVRQVRGATWSCPLLSLGRLDRGYKVNMIDSSIEDGGNPAPDMGMERAKLRTISCSTEESGVDSSSLPSVSECSSPNTVSAHSEAESDTSDYPRNSPSPANNVQRAVLSRRRPAMPPSLRQTNKNLKVSLPKLSLPCPHGNLSQSNKKIRLDPDKSLGASQEDSPTDCKCNVKVLPENIKLQNGNLKVKSECERQKTVIGHFNANHVKTETDEMKMEIAKIDSILQGKLLLDKSSHKLCDMVILDKMGLDCKVKQEFDSSFDKKQLQFSHIKNEKSCKVEEKEVQSNNNNNNVGKDFKLKTIEEEEVVSCKWEGCGARMRVQHLLDHLSSVHVTPQQTGQTGRVFQCLWVGCKVFSTSSTSFSWLSSHVTSHVGKKPFICMVDGCTQRFSSQLSLSRHVNSHFKNPSSPSTNSQPRKSTTASPIKFYIRKNRRKIKPTVGRHSSKPELFHIGIMAGIKEKNVKSLSRISSGPKHKEITFDQTGNEIIFHHRIKSRKLDEDGNIQYLVSWLPDGMFAEEWISKKNLKPHRRVTLSQVSPAIKEKVEDYIFGRQDRQKQPRKPHRSFGPPKLT